MSVSKERAVFDILGKINAERNLRGWSEYHLAEKSGLTQSTISTWKKRNIEPSVASIEKICNGFGITLAEFFHDERENKTETENAELFSLIKQLTPEQRKAVIDMIKTFLTD